MKKHTKIDWKCVIFLQALMLGSLLKYDKYDSVKLSFSCI